MTTPHDELSRWIEPGAPSSSQRLEALHTLSKAGIFAGVGYNVQSNKEHGEGRSDIVIYNDVTGQVAVFEAKYSRKLEDLEKDCQKALDQINTKMYAKEFEDAYEEVLCYGIAFYKKRCLVKSK